MKYNNFCQQFQSNFAITEATSSNQILFVALSLQDQINFSWQQYKRKLEENNLVLIIWDELKTLFYKSLGDFWVFNNSY